MGAGASQLAFQVPNLFRRLLGEGALTASFIPIFKEKEKTTTKEEMWRAANAVISGLLAVASVLSVVVMLGITGVLKFGSYSREQPAGFSVADFKDLDELTKKFKEQSTPAMAFLWERFSEPTRQAVLNYNGSRAASKALKAMLAQDFSAAIHGGPIYEPNRFAGTKLSMETTNLLAANPAGEKLAVLNRLLLEDVCGAEITDHIKETGLMLRLLRVMFPYMLLICLTAIFM